MFFGLRRYLMPFRFFCSMSFDWTNKTSKIEILKRSFLWIFKAKRYAKPCCGLSSSFYLLPAYVWSMLSQLARSKAISAFLNSTIQFVYFWSHAIIIYGDRHSALYRDGRMSFLCMLRLVPAHQKQKLQKVSAAIYGLALVYVLMVVWYVGFEKVIINYRPVLLDGALEASYPSSHTMMVVTILWTGILAFKTIFPEHQKLCFGSRSFRPRWSPLRSLAVLSAEFTGSPILSAHFFYRALWSLCIASCSCSIASKKSNDIISV